MCSLDLYNWYENRYPDDFKQLIKIKHYNISDLTFLLSKVWSKLDHGEKLLMCAVYYDDLNLAKQMLNEKLLFKVNPFWSKRYFTKTPCKGYFSSSGSVGFRFQDTNFDNEIFESGISRDLSSQCWCKSDYNFASRLSISSFKQTNASVNEEYEDMTDLGSIGSESTFSIDSPTYYFDQRISDFTMHSAFYFAIKLNKFKMCQMFIENLSQLFFTSLSLPLINKKIHNRRCGNSNQSTIKQRVYLNSFIKENELVKLLVLALSKNSYDIAVLILSNVEKPKLILNFKNLSESFIYQQDFCLYLVKNKIVEPKQILKESTNRHAIKTTTTLINYLEKSPYYNLNKPLLLDIYKSVLLNSISIGDINIFRLALAKLMVHLTTPCFQIVEEILNHVTIENILDQNFHNVFNRIRLRSFSTGSVDLNTTTVLATSKGFDCSSYFNPNQCSSQTESISVLSHFNRLKLVQFLFNVQIGDHEEKYYKDDEENVRVFEACLRSEWTTAEKGVQSKLVEFSNFFEPQDESGDTDRDLIKSASSISSSKRVYLGRYFLIRDSEPLLVKTFIENLKDTYVVTKHDLISAAKNASSELTLYYLLSNLEFNKQNSDLLESLDDLYGNFLEILFCRLVKCNNRDQELRLRRLFMEAVVLKNAKMTCSTNLLSLFVTNNQFIKKRLLNVYFPCLFYLSNSFHLFQSNVHRDRFQMLVSWVFKCLFKNQHKCGEDKHKIDLILFEYYSMKSNNFSVRKIDFNFDFSLKDLARNAFMKVYLDHANKFKFIDLINDSNRRFLFYFKEIKNLFYLNQIL